VNKQLTTITFFNPVQGSIQSVEGKMRSAANGHHPDLKSALDHLLSSGGKRIRPAVALLTGRMLGADEDRLITLAAAIELLHTATLVHDDLIDGSLLRRGIPTLNSQWSPAATVLTGDYIFARAAKLASDTGSVEVMDVFAETLSTIVNGEISQLFKRDIDSIREDYYKRIYAKTASMFVLATTASAMLSPMCEDALEPVRKFGYGIGMAFQIIDDVLDFSGDQEKIGKPVASDLRQGLITLPTIYYLESEPDDPDLSLALNGILYDELRLTRLIQGIRNSGALEKSIEEAGQHISRAMDALEDLPQSVEHQALEDLANYIIRRHY
jgi:geranylgeranyl pyrophosphate synthase